MTSWLATVLEGCLAFLSGASHGRSAFRRVASFALASAALVVPHLAVDAPRLVRSLLALASILPMLRFFDFEADPRVRTPWFRGLAVLLPYDLRELRATERRVDLVTFARGAVHGLVFALGLVLVRLPAARGDDGGALVLRTFGAVLATYGVMDAASTTLLFLHRLAGREFPPMQDHPILARSLREFWAERWNRTVNRWLRRRCFAPLVARKRPRLAMVATFVVSGLVHFVLLLPGAGFAAACVMASYFVVQAALVALEMRWSWPRRSPSLARAYALLAVLVPAPLFTEPLLLGLGLRGG